MKKFTSFCQVLKKMHTKEYWFIFSASECRCGLLLQTVWRGLSVLITALSPENKTAKPIEMPLADGRLVWA